MGGEYQVTKPYSEKTAEKMDEEVKKIIAEQYERAKSILTKYKEGHGELAQILVDREVIFAEDVKRIFGERPWKSRADELNMENNAQESDEKSGD
jgi:cell division protease FtsH